LKGELDAGHAACAKKDGGAVGAKEDEDVEDCTAAR